MLTLSFEEFANPNNFPDFCNIELYVLRNKKNILYIGISKSNVWNRWFGSRGRMYKAQTRSGVWDGAWGGNDSVAWHIIKNMPKSLKWNIDLWILQECLEFLEIEFVPHPEYPNFLMFPNNFGRYEINDVEPKMIGVLYPELNRTYNTSRPTKRAADGECVSRYFEFIKRFATANEVVLACHR